MPILLPYSPYKFLELRSFSFLLSLHYSSVLSFNCFRIYNMPRIIIADPDRFSICKLLLSSYLDAQLDYVLHWRHGGQRLLYVSRLPNGNNPQIQAMRGSYFFTRRITLPFTIVDIEFQGFLALIMLQKYYRDVGLYRNIYRLHLVIWKHRSRLQLNRR